MAGIFSAFKQLFTGSETVSTPVPPKVESLEEKQARYRREALLFAKQKHSELSHKQYEQNYWQRQYGKQQAAELSQLSGTEFEEYLAGLFRHHGYQVEMTPTSGDYGADLLLTKQGERTAVQAKCYTGSVGVSAVQEALSGMAYYHCQSAWVVTTGSYTPNAIELARKSNVRLLDSTELGILIKQIDDKRAPQGV
ncbi:MAG: restriction endonuclease [Methylomicrobium sp.]